MNSGHEELQRMADYLSAGREPTQGPPRWLTAIYEWAPLHFENRRLPMLLKDV